MQMKLKQESNRKHHLFNKKNIVHWNEYRQPEYKLKISVKHKQDCGRVKSTTSSVLGSTMYAAISSNFFGRTKLKYIDILNKSH
jgi:hypothetical protein